VEKGMADVRMLLMFGQVPEATQALDHMESEVAQLPPRWTEQFEALKKEVRDKKAEMDRPGWSPLDGKTAEIPAPFNATGVIQPDSFPAADAGDGRVTEPLPAAMPRVDPTAETAQFAPAEAARDVLYPRGEPGPDFETKALEKTDAGKPDVAPELREFLEPDPSRRSRSTVWLGVALVVLVVVFAWLSLRPKAESTGNPKTPGAASYTYAEINAEPWATVTAVTPASGDAQSIVGQSTPLRVKLPPGEYTVTLQGPNHDTKDVDVTVPQTGGASCFAVFAKPDLNRIVGRE
jgi:hypothetical protein